LDGERAAVFGILLDVGGATKQNVWRRSREGRLFSCDAVPLVGGDVIRSFDHPLAALWLRSMPNPGGGMAVDFVARVERPAH